MMTQSTIDYFKLFKIFDLKKLQKTGQVKIIQDKVLFKKVLSVQGVVSTDSSISFNTSNYINISFREQYLYILGYCQSGKTFCFQVQYFLNSKQYKIVFSTVYKDQFKRKNDNSFNMKLQMPFNKWTILAIDLYSIVNWDSSFKNDKDAKLSFRISNIQVRAHSKIKGIYQTDNLYSPHNLPKQMQFNPEKPENFYDKYNYVLIGLNIKQQIQNQLQEEKQCAKKIQQYNKKLKQTGSKPQKDRSNQKNEINHKDKRLIKNKSVQKQKSTFPNRLSQNKSLSKSKSLKTKQKAKHELQQQNDQVQQQIQCSYKLPPNPIPSISITLESVEGISCFQKQVLSTGSLIIKPLMLQTHKYITKMCKGRLGKVLVAYEDGSLCIWDTIRKQQILYFKSQFDQIRVLQMDYDMNIIIVGLDKLKRQVIQIISEQNIIFKQISNFSIINLKLIAQESFQFGFISYGLQNIRIWMISPQNQLINGHSIYLGQTARGVTYRDCQIILTSIGKYAFVCDSAGYITKVNIDQQKMEGIIKIEDLGIDHIRLVIIQEVQKILVCNQKGVIKILNCQNLMSQMQIPLDYRIKNLYIADISSCQYSMIMETYSKTLCQLNLKTFNFQFLIRSHTQQISHILNFTQYENQRSNFKVVSAGRDNTLRIWKNCEISQKEHCLKEEYQFLINGENILQVSISNHQKQGNFVFVITDAFKIRKINVNTYQIVSQVTINKNHQKQTILTFCANQKGKFLLLSTTQKTYLLDNNLQILHIYNYESLTANKKLKKIEQNILGFNKRTKCFYYYNPLQNQIQFYSLKNLEEPLFKIKPYQKVICLQWLDDVVHIITTNEYQMYFRQILKQVLPILMNDSTNSNSFSLNYPILCRFEQNRLSIQILNRSLRQSIKMPQQINKVSIVRSVSISQSQEQGVIICSGKKSFSLYYLRYKLINMNLSDKENFNMMQTQIDNQLISNQFLQSRKTQNQNQPILDISFSQTASRNNTVTFKQDSNTYKKHQINHYLNEQKQFQQFFKNQPKQLKKLYQQEQKIFDQCKNAIFGDYFQNQQQQQTQNQQHFYQEQFTQDESHEILKLKNFYGFETRQSLFEAPNGKKKKKQIQNKMGRFNWSTEFQQMVLLTNNQKSLLIHKFSENISHKLINFKCKPSAICWTNNQDKNSRTKMKYYVVCLNSIIKLYNIENMAYIRSIQNQTLIKNQHVIFQCCVSPCNSYLLTLSYVLPQYLSNPNSALIYIFLIQISSGKTVTCSYLQTNQNCFFYNICLNEFCSSLEFVIVSEYKVYFYRVSSIFTLQMLQLQGMEQICKQKIEAITCVKYIKIQNDTYLFLGSQNGSLAIIDNRTANVVLVCMNICQQPIQYLQLISSSSSNQETFNNYDKLILFTKSNIINSFTLKNGLTTLIQFLNKNQTSILNQKNDPFTIQRSVLLDGELQSVSVINNTQQLVITKNGTLWLVDYQDFCTIKISSIHSQQITQSLILSNKNKDSNFDSVFLLTSSKDGYVKLTNLEKFQQNLQIYKPRKQAKCFNVNQNYTVCCFNQEIYFYDSIMENKDPKNIQYLGSLKLESDIIDISHIPYSDNYYVLSQKQLFIIFVKKKEKFNNQIKNSFVRQSSLIKFSINIQMKLITEVTNAFKIQLNPFRPYDEFAVLNHGGKINIWIRKCLKRTSNPLNQLSQVQNLEYYLLDAYTRSQCLRPSLVFTSQNEYAFCLGQRSLIQIRNYKQHTILSQLSFSCQKITSMLYYLGQKRYENSNYNEKNKWEHTIFIGDSYGYIYMCDKNGFIIEKMKLFEGPISNISLTQTQKFLILNLVSERYCALVRLKYH